MRPEPLILAFDTSAAHCAAALLSGDRLVDLQIEEMALGQAERLMPMLEAMLARAGIGWGDLAAIGVGTGPGNFTGIRISVAAARGLALGLAIPAIGVSTFEAMALDAPRPAVVVLDARRGQLYAQLFAEAAEPPRLLDEGEALTVPPGTTFLGHDADRFALTLDGRSAQPRHAMVQAIARLARDRLGQAAPRPAPFYLRGADAAPPADPPPVMLP